MKHVAFFLIVFFTIHAFSSDPIYRTFRPENFAKDFRYHPYGQEIMELDSEICNGCYLSFTLDLSLITSDTTVFIEDARGDKWPLSDKKSIIFRRLKTPARIVVNKPNFASKYLDIHLNFSDVLVEFQENTSMVRSFSNKFQTYSSEIIKFFPYFFKHADIEIGTKFFANYEAGTACYRFTLVGANGDRFSITKETSRQFIRRISLPAFLLADPICQSTHLEKPENKNKDYDLLLQVWPTI